MVSTLANQTTFCHTHFISELASSF